MSLKTRRTVFQLTPLLDLLLIVIFAQYMDVRQAGARQEEWFEKEAQTVLDEADRSAQKERELRAAAQVQLDQLLAEIARMREERTSETELKNDLLKQREVIGEFLSETLNLPEDVVTQLLDETTIRQNQDVESLRKLIEALSKLSPGEAVKHVLSYNELLKRCDLWNFSIGWAPGEKEYIYRLEAGGQIREWRNDTIVDIETELVDYIRSLPQPKSIVIILGGFTYEDIIFRERRLYPQVMNRCVKELNAFYLGQSLFYTTDLGYLGDLNAN
jgi:hypothetical protein